MQWIKKIVHVAMHAEWLLSLGGLLGLGGVVGSFSIAAWAASASGWVNAYGPIGWVCAGFLGAMAFSVVYLGYAISRLRLAKAALYARRAETPTSINPLEDTFKREIITIADLYSVFHQDLRGKHFQECRFVGPMVLAFADDLTMRNPSMNECNFVVIGPGFVSGVVRFGASTFVDCDFDSVTFLIPPNVAKMIRDNAPKGEVNFLGAPID